MTSSDIQRAIETGEAQARPKSAAPAPKNRADVHPVPGAPVVSFQDAGVRLGRRWVWQHVTLEIEAGQFVAVLGPNGAGKSTLLKAALGLIPLSKGSVQILGTPPRRGCRHVGYLPQRRSFDSDVRIRGIDVVRLGLEGDHWGFSLPWPTSAASAARAAKDARTADVVRLVGATGYAERPIGELSGGEQQRLLIAQALAASPNILFLDEPLESLDQTNQQQVSALLKNIARGDGVSVLLVTHDINPVLPFVDRVIYVATGRAVVGAPEDVVNTEALSELYRVTVEVLRTSDGRLIVVGQPEPETLSYHGTS